jgi:hypothetical protein
MKLLSTLTIAALLAAGSAFGASTPTATAGATATPATAPAAKKMGHCERQAKAKNLAGDSADAFVKECKAAHAKKTN